MQRIKLLLLVFCVSFGYAQAQSLEELKSQKAEKEAMFGDLEGQLDATQGEIDALQREIDILSGWRKGINGLVGFDWNKSNGWIANPNPDAQSSALNFDLTAYLMNDKEKTFWHNKANLVKAWTDVDLSAVDDTIAGDGLFDNGTVDLLNLSSLAGYKLSDKFALSGQAEVNTSLGNFLKPGTMDIGVGATWLPIENMTVMIHPLNYHFAWPSKAELDNEATGLKSKGSIGAKVRVDYFNDFLVGGKEVHWSSTLSTFIPYSDVKQNVIAEDGSIVREAGLMEYTWINKFSFEVWKGIGVGLGFGLRNSDLESSKTQTYSSLGLTYGI